MTTDSALWFLGKIIEYISEPYQSWDKFIHSLTLAFRQFTALTSKTGLVYLGASLVIAIGIFVYEKRKSVIDAHTSLIKFLFPVEIYRHPSAIVDYKYVLIDLTIKPLTYLPVISGTSYVFYQGTLFIRESTWLGLLSITVPTSPILAALCTVLVADFGFFFGHYLAHKIPFFWCFHQVHHSAEVLTPITVYRGHPVDELLGAVVSSVTGVLAISTYGTVTETEIGMVTVLGVNVFNFVFFLCAYQLRHSHIWLSYGPVLSLVFISPAQHQIHHSVDSKHWNKNFGFLFAFWDLLWGSLYVPKAREHLKLGISGVDQEDFSTVWKLYSLPFVKAFKSLSLRK